MKKILLALIVLVSTTTAMAGDLVPVFQETFSRCTSSVIQGGYLSEDYYFTSAEHGDNDGWTTHNAYVSERALKFSAKTKPAGYAVTPALKLSGDVASKVVVKFRAQTWAHKDDKLDICVQVEGDDATVQTVDGDVSVNVADRNAEPFEMTFANVPDGAKFRFFAKKKEGAKTDRWFLSDVVVLEEVGAAASAAIYTTAGYQRFSDLMIGNASEERHIDVVGAGLAGDIIVALAEGSAFKVAPAEGWNARTGGRLTVTFDPSVAGTAEEKLTISSGEAKREVVLYGHSKVYAPVAMPATEVEPTSFTARWDRVAGCDRIELTVYTKEEGPLTATDLMFSKYIEGKSNNRAVEIFNGTGHDVDLTGWCMRMESNGAGGLTFGEYKFPAGAVIAAGETFTVCNAQCSALRDIANVTIGFQDGGYANIMTFTGDDAIGLFNPEGRLVDILGYESVDVNDEVSGNWGMDQSYYRKSSCYEPGDKFIPSQWDIHEMDYVEGYGSHTLDATGPVKRVVKTLMLERGATSAVIEGIDADKPCYYTVQGHSGALKTLPSAEIAVGNVAGVEGVDADAAPAFTLTGGVLRVESGARVYDVAGRSLAVDADGCVALGQRGVYLIVAGRRAAKVVY